MIGAVCPIMLSGFMNREDEDESISFTMMGIVRKSFMRKGGGPLQHYCPLLRLWVRDSSILLRSFVDVNYHLNV